MHHKKIAVFLPVRLIGNFSERIERIAKVGINRFLQPIDVLNYLIGILLIMDMIEFIILLFVFNKIGGKTYRSRI